MGSSIVNIVIDCADPDALADFWAAALGSRKQPNPESADHVSVPLPGGGPRLHFQRVCVPKTVKNRLHFDLRPVTGTRDEELQRLLDLGATEVADLREPDGAGWVVLADPEGNEFCILRSRAELHA